MGSAVARHDMVPKRGPAFTHEYLEVFDSYFPGAGIEYDYYDQLGSDFLQRVNAC